VQPVQYYCLSEEVDYILYTDNRNHGLLLDMEMYTLILSSKGSLKNQTAMVYTKCHFSVKVLGFIRNHL
jgi:hypothetical protein